MPAARWFMVAMRDPKIGAAFHGPERRSPNRPVFNLAPHRADSEIGAPLLRWFVVAMRGQKTVEATREPILSRPAATLSSPSEGEEREGRGVVGFRATIREPWRLMISLAMNL